MVGLLKVSIISPENEEVILDSFGHPVDVAEEVYDITKEVIEEEHLREDGKVLYQNIDYSLLSACKILKKRGYIISIKDKRNKVIDINDDRLNWV